MVNLLKNKCNCSFTLLLFPPKKHYIVVILLQENASRKTDGNVAQITVNLLTPAKLI